MLSLWSCVVEDEAPKLTIPTVTTSPITSVTKSSAVGGGNVTSDGGSPILSRGIVWAKTASPDISLPTKTISGTGSGSFSSEITSLSEGSTYFVRAFAINAEGSAYGTEVSFTTVASVPPTVETVAVTEFAYTTAKISGNVTFAGDTPIIERGVVAGASPNPSVSNPANRKGTSPGETGTFTASISGLEQGTKYYARAYAINGTKTAYGADKEFTTKSIQALALAFDGVDDYVEVPHSTSLNLGNTFTLEAWVYLEDNATVFQTFIHKWATNQYTLELTNNKLSFVVHSGGANYVLESRDDFPRGDWVHIAGVRDGSVMRIYEGGLLKKTRSISGSTNTATGGSLIIGRRSDAATLPMKGKMDEIRIWNVARTTTQIDVNKTSDIPSLDPGLVAWYHLNGDGFPDEPNPGVTFFEDLTNNNNHGTLKNFALTGTTSNWTDTYTRITTFSIGKKYQGGIIASLDGSDRHGIIVAEKDQSSGAAWGCSGTSIAGAAGTTIGSGWQNTQDIINGCGTAGIAARLCNDLVLNGYKDWYLPSSGELHELYLHSLAVNVAVATITGGVAISGVYYWSSTEISSTMAKEQHLGNGSTGDYGKNNTSDNVRAVREF